MRKNIILLVIGVAALAGCDRGAKKNESSFEVPEAGARIKSGEDIDLKLALAGKADSVVYLLDSAVALKKPDAGAAKVNSGSLSMGNHLLTAKIYANGEAEEVSSNIVVLPAKSPVEYDFEIVNTYPHDTTSYTEGLIYQDGILYESDGEYDGQSSIRTTSLITGKVIKKTDLPGNIFGEGITVIGDKINQLTYKEGIRLVYDKKTLKKTGEYPFSLGKGEGWGMTVKGDTTYETDGSNVIYLLDNETFVQKGSIAVYDNNGPVDNLNELEYIDGKLYANIYMSEVIVIIDPKTGAVEGRIDLSTLYPQQERLKNNPNSDVMNGIAWDSGARRLFVTGKKWDRLFEIRVRKSIK